MSLIFGIFHTDGAPVDAKEFRRVRDDLKYWNPDYSDDWVEGDVGIGHLGLRVTKESDGEKQPLVNAQAIIVVTADVRLDNRLELAAKLGRSDGWLREQSDSAVVVASYEKWGERCVDHLIGDFAFAIWDGRRRKLFLARDHVGVKPLFYSFNKNVFIFGSELRAVVGFSSVSRDVDKKWLVNSLACIHLKDTRESTHFSAVFQLSNATSMVVSRMGIQKRCYWKLDTKRRSHFSSFENFAEGFREHFDEAVACRLRSAYPIASEISAGIDSTSILCSAIRQRGGAEGLRVYTHSVENINSKQNVSLRDECDLTDRFAAKVGLALPERIVGPKGGLFDLYTSAISQRCAPLMEVWSLFSQPLYDAVSQGGSRVLLSGAGGDDLVSSKSARAYYEMSRRFQFGKLWKELTLEGNRKGTGVGRRVKAYIANLLYGLIPKVHELRRSYSSVNSKRNFISPVYSKKFHIEQRTKSFLENVNCWDLRERQSLLATELYLSRCRLPESSISARMRHLEMRYPMLDIRLMEYCLSAPSEYKRKDGYGRYLLRGSMIDLPDFIRWRESSCVAANPWAARLSSSMKTEFEELLDRLMAIPDVVEILNLPLWDEKLKGLRTPDDLLAPDWRTAMNLAGIVGLFLSEDKH